MSFVDMAIPAGIGLVAILWPQVMFWGSRKTPDPGKLRLIRIGGAVLVVVALGYLGITLVRG